LKKIDQLATEAKARRDAFDSGEGFQRALVLKDGQTCTGRFLEEGDNVWYLYTHDLPKKPGQRYADKTLCLDQAFTAAEAEHYVDGTNPCYACGLEGVSRPTRVVINFIRYDEPNLVRDAQGKAIKENGEYKFDGTKPELVVCNFSTGIGGRLSFLESHNGPLTNHVCTIHKTGDKNNPYMIDVVEKGKPAEDFERVLFEKKVEPPTAITQLGMRKISRLSFAEMKHVYSGAGVPTGFAPAGDQQPAQPENIYAQQAANAAAGGGINLGAFG
jgi:hypothetical protein